VTRRTSWLFLINQADPAAAVDSYVGEVCSQHNPAVAKDKTTFTEPCMRVSRDYPGKRVPFKRVSAEGDDMVLHCFQEWPGDRDSAGIDVFRLDERGEIVGHWDVLQPIPEGSANENTMF
jgi:predicted SnoaL-like aldol condensation-catalyzing enzyme